MKKKLCICSTKTIKTGTQKNIPLCIYLIDDNENTNSASEAAILYNTSLYMLCVHEKKFTFSDFRFFSLLHIVQLPKKITSSHHIEC